MSRKHILKERDTHMPIQIIAGGSGSGKTTCVINEVIKNNDGSNILIEINNTTELTLDLIQLKIRI